MNSSIQLERGAIDDGQAVCDQAGSLQERIQALAETLRGQPDVDAASALREALPELHAIEELRSQFRARMHRRVEAAKPYDGIADPIEYLLEHYGEEIREGQLRAGRLCAIDPKLHDAVRYQLGKGQPSKTVGQFMDELAGYEQPSRTNYRRRIGALATLLGSTEAEAAKFFGSIHANRHQPSTSERGR